MKYTDEYWDDVDEAIRCIPSVENLHDKSIMITGATGMVCSSVVEVLFRLNFLGLNTKLYLAGRNKSRVMERFSGFREGEDYTFVAYDATKSFNCDIPTDYIIHGASNANPAIYTREPVETMLSNIIGLQTLLDMAVRNNSKRLLYVSSSEVYGKKEGDKLYSETDYGYVDLLNPRACYPSAKRAAETLCSSYGEEYGIETVIVRPGHIYGPTITRTDSRASAQFTWDVVDGNDIVMKSAGEQIRSYCYTLDCASAILTVLINGEDRNAYNISNRDSVVSIRELAEKLAECSGRRIIFENPSDAEKRGYNLMNNSALDAEKLESLGWKGIFDLQRGVDCTLRTLLLE